MQDHLQPKRSHPNVVTQATFEDTTNSRLLARRNPIKLYPITPSYVAKKISSKELNEDKEDRNFSPTWKLHQISEDPREENLHIPFEKSKRALSVDSEVLAFDLPEIKTSIFQSDLYGSSKFHEHTRGPVYLNGKLLKHSVVGPIDMFERQQKRRNHGNSTKQQQQDTDSSFTTFNESLTNISRRPNRQPTFSMQAESPLNRSQVGRRTLEPKRKDIQEIKVPKDLILTEIDKIRARQNNFYRKIDGLAHGMRRSDMLFFTKEQRCLESFEKTEDRWNKVFEQTNTKIGRSPLQSPAFKAEEHREKIERADEVELLRSREERLGPNFWYLTLRKFPENNEPRGTIITDEFPAAFRKAIIEKRNDSIEFIRKPRRLNGSLNRWASESLMSTYNMSGSLHNRSSLNRSTEEYFESVIKRGTVGPKQYKPPAESMQDLMVN